MESLQISISPAIMRELYLNYTTSCLRYANWNVSLDLVDEPVEPNAHPKSGPKFTLKKVQWKLSTKWFSLNPTEFQLTKSPRH